MSGEFRFETFVDVHSNIFNEYLSSVIAKLSKENEEYRAVQVEIESLYEKYPKVFGVFDTEKSAELTEEKGGISVKLMPFLHSQTEMLFLSGSCQIAQQS